MKYRISIGKYQFEVRVENIHSRPILAIVEGETFEVWPEGPEATSSAAAATQLAAPLPDTAVAPEAPLPGAVPEVLEGGPATVGAHREVRAPLPGTIISLAITPGTAVGVGQELCVLEAMKMKNPLRATRAGIIRAVHVTVGQTVKHQDLLLEFSD